MNVPVAPARSVTRWIAGNPCAASRVRLFCFHHAGGGASLYRDWLRPDAFPARLGLRVLPVQLPGREDRFREAPFRSMQPLVAALLASLGPFLVPPFAFFGHSMGALVAYELSRQLSAAGHALPVHVFLSAKRPPHLPQRTPLAGLPDVELAAALRTLNGTPAEVLEDRELLDLMLPILRADFSVTETYSSTAADPIACPITVLVGTHDPEVGLTEAWAWACHTREPLSVRAFDGDHFYLHAHLPAVRQAIATQLDRDCAR